jgi:transposase InsO family protein
VVDEKAATAISFLERALGWYAGRGVRVQRVMTDNGACYRSHAWARVCAHHQLRHLRTRAYRPRTNGKAERFIQTLLREWAYAAAYQTSRQRALALTPWLDYYNQQRPHGALGHQPPAARHPLPD